MTLLQMRYIIAVSEEKNITRAAEKLHIAQPSLSRMIAAVESEYKIQLFNHVNKSLEITKAGTVFIQYAKNIVNQFQNLESALSDFGNTEFGRLTFGCSSNHMGYLLPSFLKEISARFPYLEISVVDDSSSSLFRQAALGRIDIVYSQLNGEFSNDLIYDPVVEEELLLVVPSTHPLAARAMNEPNWRSREPIHLQEINDEPFIQVRKSHSIYTKTNKLFTENNFNPNVCLTVSTNVVAHHLVASGLGISILPESELRFNPTQQECVFFPLENRSCTRTLYLAHHKNLYMTNALVQSMEVIKEIATGIFMDTP